MREIKFRYFDKDRNRMEDGSGYMFSSEGSMAPSWIVPLQWTGLKDKNGVEIYEGDIIKWHYGGNWEVVWINGHSSIGELDDEWGEQIGFGFRSKELDEVTGYPKLEPLTSDRIYEVIGNIYENKDLLT